MSAQLPQSAPQDGKFNAKPSNLGGGHPLAQDRITVIGIDVICECLAGGKTLTDVSREIGVAVSSMITWTEATPERSARVRASRGLSARVWDDKATSIIEEAADPFELAKAKELAYHYRWRSSKIAPKEYGDKLDVTYDGKIELNDAQLDARIDALGSTLIDAFSKARVLRLAKAAGKEE